MKGRIGRVAVAAMLSVGAIVMATGPAFGVPTIENGVETVDDTFLGEGCLASAPETIHVSGWERIGVVADDDLFLIHVNVRLRQSWVETETGEAFAGSVSGPWSFRAVPAGGETFSDVFTAIARGDQGTTALFTSRFHATVAATGEVTVELQRLSGTCR